MEYATRKDNVGWLPKWSEVPDSAALEAMMIPAGFTDAGRGISKATKRKTPGVASSAPSGAASSSAGPALGPAGVPGSCPESSSGDSDEMSSSSSDSSNS